MHQVSNLGRVKSLISGGLIMNGSTYKEGYKYVCLGKKKHKIHRLVAHMFLDNYENKPVVDHINTIRDDNRVENLRWATHLENNKNEITYINRHGENWFSSKGVYIDGEKISNTAKEASQILGITYGTIRRWLNGTTDMPNEWSSRGLKYIDGAKTYVAGAVNGRSTKVMLDGEIIASTIKDASMILGVKVSTLSTWLNRSHSMPEDFKTRGLCKVN